MRAAAARFARLLAASGRRQAARAEALLLEAAGLMDEAEAPSADEPRATAETVAGTSGTAAASSSQTCTEGDKPQLPRGKIISRRGAPSPLRSGSALAAPAEANRWRSEAAELGRISRVSASGWGGV